MVKENQLSLEEALPYVTSNVADAIGLNNKKGKLIEQADADILILDKNMELSSVIAHGQVMMQCGKLLKKGTYE